MMRSVLLLLSAALCACARGESPPPISGPLRVGVLPTQTEDVLRRRYEPLIRHLEASTGIPMELAFPETYDALVDRLADGSLHLAWFGGLTFLRAERRCGARPLVMRDVDLEFTSVFLVPRSSADRRVQDLEARTFAFGPRLSTSGHLMPRHFLGTLGIDPEAFFSDVRHSAAHDQTATWVQEGEVDVGVADALVVESMLRDGRLQEERVRVLQWTMPFRNYVWAVSSDVGPEIEVRLLDAFMELDEMDAGHAAILAPLGTRGYVPAGRGDFDDLRAAAESTGLLTEVVSQ